MLMQIISHWVSSRLSALHAYAFLLVRVENSAVGLLSQRRSRPPASVTYAPLFLHYYSVFLKLSR